MSFQSGSSRALSPSTPFFIVLIVVIVDIVVIVVIIVIIGIVVSITISHRGRA
jgi:hypothetical protein